MLHRDGLPVCRGFACHRISLSLGPLAGMIGAGCSDPGAKGLRRGKRASENAGPRRHWKQQRLFEIRDHGNGLGQPSEYVEKHAGTHWQKTLLGWGWGDSILLLSQVTFRDHASVSIDDAHNLPLHLAVVFGVPRTVLMTGAKLSPSRGHDPGVK